LITRDPTRTRHLLEVKDVKGLDVKDGSLHTHTHDLLLTFACTVTTPLVVDPVAAS
jgi:hypothetical protein